MMRDVMYVASASSALRPVLAAPARPAVCLGVSRGALYLKTAGPPGALVVLSHDAVRLPCGLVLPATSEELPLTSLVAGLPIDTSAAFVVGDGAVSWTGPAGPVVVRAVRGWAPARLARGDVAAGALAAVRSLLGDSGLDAVGLGAVGHGGYRFGAAGPGSACPDAGRPFSAGLAAAAGDRDAAVAAATSLLGAGPGLTPSGDDVLAGFLAGAAAFGIDATALREATAVLAPARTTALSAALLWHAARGECIDELAGLAAVLTSQRWRSPELAGRAVSRLLSVGHTSGAALALGLVTAADRALHPEAALTGQQA